MSFTITNKTLFKRYFTYPVQGFAVWLLFHFARLLPLDWASAIGGFITRTIGPLIPANQRARRNIVRCFPEKSEAEIEAIIKGMWDNLGRTAFEFPHLDRFQPYDDPTGRVTTIGGENVDFLRDDGKPGIFFSGHIGNWEIISYAATKRGVPLHRIYRAANNPYLEWIYRLGRSDVEGGMVAKGASGARYMLSILNKGGHIGMLLDQKQNDGIAVPFFGREAMTAPALASFARKFECPIIPARVIRLKGATFRVELLPPMVLPPPLPDRAEDMRMIMTEVNKLLEGFIREHPEQWLWLHRRWPD
jgi:KDO2-lipid IV(A) lauroyltransferase